MNSQTASRHGEYFREQLPIGNSSSAQWTNITVCAPGQTDVSGHEFVAKNQEQFLYDLDGNLVSDGRWNYGWDGENRLTSMTNNNLSAGPQQVLHFEYDSKSRRIHKQVWGTNVGGGVATNDLKFAYDGWNLIGEVSAGNSPVRTYLWGLDLSGAEQGAGGVGGLLECVHYGAYRTNTFVAFDGNGNSVGLINGADGSLLAQFDYGPFGELLRATGPMARANPFRFSTKYQDDDSDLLYYGYRSYNPSTGRWTGRDPIEEEGGLNLYAMVNNSPVSMLDYLGLAAPDPGHQKEIRKVAKALSKVCNSRCIDRCSDCTKQRCQVEALAIAQAYVRRVYEVRRDDIPNDHDRHWGWLCYEWAGLVFQPLAKLKLDCWTIRWVGYVQVPPSDGALLHNYVFASIGKSVDHLKGPVRDCGKVLDPWRNGRPDVWDVSDWKLYQWNFTYDPATGTQWYWNGQAWVDAHFNIPPTPQYPN